MWKFTSQLADLLRFNFFSICERDFHTDIYSTNKMRFFDTMCKAQLGLLHSALKTLDQTKVFKKSNFKPEKETFLAEFSAAVFSVIFDK